MGTERGRGKLERERARRERNGRREGERWRESCERERKGERKRSGLIPWSEESSERK
jgi:hypothetical protein